ncbi:hypothetical protein SELMODRAFT_424865 [Selaginella moellendorffii]|uniref:Uncharacterized protein n=1 Tax=Selaginella moellendorffii TaxID=88036 RepID=D8SR95_SELML|nr:protein NEDD1 [Selaginella moellendorffii]EFJ13106.1 hypothetical protein SELMODRAFT_424865 [Selaginella moellendorffii]|eukprot:XP_002985929.1 protein NEDD1 [Selaginella moellendorffii]
MATTTAVAALLLAASSGEIVKAFDTSTAAGQGDPCLFQYSPAPDSQINSVKWNHTNMVLASAGDDGKISLWTQKLQSVVTIASDPAESVVESILAMNFSTKSSRYLCSGGTAKVVRIWDLQRKRCIKWLKGHADTITSVMYNCKDEHVASASVAGDLILHNLASGSRIAELKDPHRQVLRVLEFSRLSRHLLVTSGDDGSVHFWETTGRSPKISWIKQHLAPTTGVCFSPPNDKVVASVGLDKKLYIFDVGVKRPVHSVACETPYSSAAFRDDGVILAAGTNDGRVVFYDIRGGKPQPSMALRAYGASKAVTSLSWQRSNPIQVNEKSWTMEMALLGPGRDDPVIMPDPLPPSIGRGRSKTEAMPLRNAGRSSLGSEGAILRPPTGEETPSNYLLTNGNVSRLQISRNDFMRDDMEVFSPLVDVQPIMPSATKNWDTGAKNYEGDGFLKYSMGAYKLPSFEDSSRETFQDSSLAATPPAVRETRSPSVTPPEAWGGDAIADRGSLRLHSTSRFASGTASASAALSGHVRVDARTVSAIRSPVKLSPAEQKAVNPESCAPPERSLSWDTTALAEQLLLANRRGLTEEQPGTDEIRENGMDLRHDFTASTTQPQASYKRSPQQPAPPAFGLQLVQRALEESLSGVHKSIHEDVHNLHLELLRQFHIQQSEMNVLMNKVLTKQNELMDEIKTLRRENQQLLQYL